MSNEMITVNTSQTQDEQIKNWSSWKSWNATINEHSAIVGMQFLKELCEAYQTALTKTKEKYENDKKRIYDRNISKLTSITNREGETIRNLAKEHNEAMAVIAVCEKESYVTYHDDLEKYLENNESKGFFRKIIEKMIAGQTSAMESSMQVSYHQTQAIREKLLAALNAQCKQQELLYQEKKKTRKRCC